MIGHNITGRALRNDCGRPGVADMPAADGHGGERRRRATLGSRPPTRNDEHHGADDAVTDGQQDEDQAHLREIIFSFDDAAAGRVSPPRAPYVPPVSSDKSLSRTAGGDLFRLGEVRER